MDVFSDCPSADDEVVLMKPVTSLPLAVDVIKFSPVDVATDSVVPEISVDAVSRDPVDPVVSEISVDEVGLSDSTEM